MVDWSDRWTPEDDYSQYPKEKWCDLDMVADFVVKQGYVPKTSLENLVVMLVLHFEGEIEDEESWFGPECNEDGTYNLSGLEAFIEASGGLSEFDYSVD